MLQVDRFRFHTLFLSLLNSPALIFEIFPFIILITVQLTFVKLFENQEIEIFKYSGLKNSKIILIISMMSIFTGIVVLSMFYNLSSNLKNIYLELNISYLVTFFKISLQKLTKNLIDLKLYTEAAHIIHLQELWT